MTFWDTLGLLSVWHQDLAGADELGGVWDYWKPLVPLGGPGSLV